MKLTIRSVLFCYFLVSMLCLLPVYAEDAGNPRSVMDMIPYESLAYVSLSNLGAVFHLVTESPEWQELLGIEEIQEDLEQAKQPISFVPMLLGITVEEFLNSFGHETALSLMGMMGVMPVAGLIADVRLHREQVEYAAEQAATIPAIAGGAAVEEGEYRDVPYTVVGNKNFKVKYGFLDSFLVAGVGGGFEKLVDLYKDGGKSIKDSPNFQFMEQKVSLSSEICVYADLERAAPMLEMLANIGSGKEDEEGQLNAMIKQLALKSAKAFALSLSLSGQTHEVYLHLRPEESNPITDLVLAPHSPMSTAALVPFADGLLVGIHIGDPAGLLDSGLKTAEFLGKETKEIEDQTQQMESGLGLNLRDDLLSTLTGEFAVMAMLPKGQVDLKRNKPVQMAMQIAKVRQVAFIGVKDGERLQETAKKLCNLANLKTLSLGEQSYNGTKIYTKAVPLDMLVPGVAIMPSYAFRENLLIASNSAEWVQDAIDMVESSGATEVQEKLSASRVMVYLDAAGIADFAVEQGIAEDIGLSEAVQGKLGSLGSIAASLSLDTDGAGIKLISTSDDNWATKILRGILVSIYANIPSEQEEAEEEEYKDEQ
jgi:hypothetical protein